MLHAIYKRDDKGWVGQCGDAAANAVTATDFLVLNRTDRSTEKQVVPLCRACLGVLYGVGRDAAHVKAVVEEEDAPGLKNFLFG